MKGDSRSESAFAATIVEPRKWSAAIIIDLLRAGEAVTFRARGGSMWPTVRDGAIVEVSPCRAEDLASGDLAAFTRNGAVIVHRVVEVNADGIHFAGDTAATGDAVVAPSEVLGRARVTKQSALHWRLPTRKHVRRLARVYARRWLMWLRRQGADERA